jgi:carbon monoxide dehydrogenase subunit G
MRITGTADLAAPPERVFEALNDPAVLAATIPGCHALQQVAPDAYAMTVTAGVASVKGTYEGRVTLSEQDPPRSFRLRANGSGAPGSVDATVDVRLAQADGGGTRLDYDADAVVGGMVGGVGQRMITGVARKMAGQFFTAVDQVIASGVPVPAPAVPAPGAAAPAAAEAAAEGVVAPAAAPVPAPSSDTAPAWVVPAAVTTGAAAALAGVLLGWLLGRWSRR